MEAEGFEDRGGYKIKKLFTNESEAEHFLKEIHDKVKEEERDKYEVRMVSITIDTFYNE